MPASADRVRVDSSQPDAVVPELPGFVPAGLYNGPPPAPEPEAYAVTIVRQVPVGTTELVRQMLKGAPRRVFCLADIAQALMIKGPLWELNACLCKMVDKGEVIKGERKAAGLPVKSGRSVIKTYRWRLPSDGG